MCVCKGAGRRMDDKHFKMTVTTTVKQDVVGVDMFVTRCVYGTTTQQDDCF